MTMSLRRVEVAEALLRDSEVVGPDRLRVLLFAFECSGSECAI
jgi:hypothetical protein